MRTVRETKEHIGTELSAMVAPWRVVGVPKRDPNESRPIAIASVLMRAWQRSIRDSLPQLAKQQWSEKGVTRAFINWMEFQGSAGTEIDLAAAFDTVQHDVAAEALAFEGTPDEVVAWLRHAWEAPRYCHVRGMIAEPLRPHRGIPAGDPLSMRVLGLVLAPWHALIEQRAPGVLKTWAYADDRSIVAKPASGDADEAAALIDEALDTTATFFDSPIGVVENNKKRQRWKGGEQCEHLGLIAAPGAQGSAAQEVHTRDGWGGYRTVAKRLAAVPGPINTRERLAATCLLPKVRWAAPMVAEPPQRLDHDVMKGISASASTHWCAARFWADNIIACPTLATAIQAIRGAKALAGCHSATLLKALDRHALRLGLQVIQVNEDSVWVVPRSGCDWRIHTAARAASHESDVPWRLRQQHEAVFNASTGAGQHAIRSAARISCLSRRLYVSARHTRQDDEGLNNADVEILTTATWKKWKAQLPARELGALRVWRSGATVTPTRMSKLRTSECPCCKAPRASTRHFWADCPALDDIRKLRQDEAGLDSSWWGHQPRCTSKSGWVTYDAAATLPARARAAVAANQLGIEVVLLCGTFDDKPPLAGAVRAC